MDHPAAETLVNLAEGRLDPAASAEVHRHVRSCDDCRMVLAGLAPDSPTTPSALDEDEAVLAPGMRVGRFVLERLVGMGGMGAVWSARDPELGRTVAVKLLRVGVGSDGDKAQSRRRLMGEAKAMARLSHPNVVPVFEVGEMGDRLFVVMELVEGETLGRWLGNQPRSLDEILDAFVDAGRGLAAAHQKGIVHRDFKPDNVLMGKDGRPRVTDFGLARRFGPGDPESLPPGPSVVDLLAGPTPDGTLTPMGALLGTPAYMSPEQMRGGLADERSDLFSYCTALWEAVGGSRPFVGKDFFELRRKAESGQVEKPKKPIPGWLRRELVKGLRTDPAQRPPSVAALIDALERSRSRARARRWLLGAAALAAALAVLGFFTRPQKPQGRRPIAVLGPRDLAPRAETGWLSGALGELLATELGADESLRLVGPQTVAPAVRDLGLTHSALQPSDAERLQKRLGAQLVTGGSYELSPQGQLRIDLEIYGPGGRELARAEASGRQETLVQLASQLGAQLRRALGGSEVLPLDKAQGSFPANAEAAALYVQGVSKLRAFEAGAAVKLLLEAERLAPGNPRIEAGLTEAYVDLGYDTPAREFGTLAWMHKEDLPREERDRIEILYRRAQRDNEQAIALARAQFSAAPDDLERGLMLAKQQFLGRKYPDSLATVEALHKLPPPASLDPRIDIQECTAATQQGDLKRGLAAAERAAATARAVGARRELAAALYNGGNSLRRLGSDPKRAMEMLKDGERLYLEANDLGGAAGASIMQAALLADGGDLPGARSRMENALELYKVLGDRGGEGAVLHNLSIVLRRMRDLPAAIERSRQAETLFLELGERGSASNSLTTLGHLREDVGDLTGAAAALAEAARIRRELKDPLQIVSLISLSRVQIMQGNLDEAAKTFVLAREAGAGQEKLNQLRLKGLEATLAFARDDLPLAVTAARDAAALGMQTNAVDETALQETQLARALLRQGKVAEARAAVGRGQALLAKSKSGLSNASLAVADARVKAAEEPRNPAAWASQLKTVLEEANKAGVAEDQWEARLALAELLPLESRAAMRSRLKSLAHEARAQGFVLYAKLAEAAAARR